MKMIGVAVQDNRNRSKFVSKLPGRSFMIDSESGMYFHVYNGGAMFFTVSTQEFVDSFEINLITSCGNKVSEHYYKLSDIRRRVGDNNNSVFEFELTVQHGTEGYGCCFYYPIISWRNIPDEDVGVCQVFQQYHLIGPIFVCVSKHPLSMKRRALSGDDKVECGKHGEIYSSIVSTAYYRQEMNKTITWKSFVDFLMKPMEGKLFITYDFTHRVSSQKQGKPMYNNASTTAIDAITELYNLCDNFSGGNQICDVLPHNASMISHCGYTSLQSMNNLPQLKRKAFYHNDICIVSCVRGGNIKLYDRSLARRNSQLQSAKRQKMQKNM